MICGVDEAGRGPALGPLVVGVVWVESDDALRELGVKDSKKLTPKRREQLYDAVTACADHWCTVTAEAEDIDTRRKTMSLNEIELRMFAEGIAQRHADTIYVDCPDINEDGFGNRLRAVVDPGSAIIAKHKADDTYPVVSAASIVAKVTRDRIIDSLREEFGTDIGSGYPSDRVTMDFIADWIRRNGTAPPHVRCSWEPVKQMLSKRKNTSLDDW